MFCSLSTVPATASCSKYGLSSLIAYSGFTTCSGPSSISTCDSANISLAIKSDSASSSLVRRSFCISVSTSIASCCSGVTEESSSPVDAPSSPSTVTSSRDGSSFTSSGSTGKSSWVVVDVSPSKFENFASSPS